MTKPKIKIRKEPLDHVLEAIAILGVLIALALVAIYVSKMPDTIPIHFGGNGKPDGFGTKYNLWILPVVGAALVFVLLFINRFPHTFNYPVDITEENAEDQYRFGNRLMRLLAAFIGVLFCFLTHRIILSAQGKANGIGKLFLPILVVFLFCVIGYYVYKSTRKLNKPKA